MQIKINLKELTSNEIAALESVIGFEGCWIYHKLRLWLLSNRSDKLYMESLPMVAAMLRTSKEKLLLCLLNLPASLCLKGRNFWQLPEIIEQLAHLEVRLKASLKGVQAQKSRREKTPKTKAIIKTEPLVESLPVVAKKVGLELPDWVDAENAVLLETWIEDRKTRKKPVSQKALNLACKKYAGDNETFKSALEASIEAGWQGIYLPTGAKGKKQAIRPSQNFVNGMHNEALVKMYEEKENVYDYESTNGEASERILRSLPQLDVKTGHG